MDTEQTAMEVQSTPLFQAPQGAPAEVRVNDQVFGVEAVFTRDGTFAGWKLESEKYKFLGANPDACLVQIIMAFAAEAKMLAEAEAEAKTAVLN